MSNNGKKVFALEQVIDNSICFIVYMDSLPIDVSYCSALQNGMLDNVAYYIDKITYLGNEEFNLEKSIETITYRELTNKIGLLDGIKQADGTIDCDLVGQSR